RGRRARRKKGTREKGTRRHGGDGGHREKRGTLRKEEHWEERNTESTEGPESTEGKRRGYGGQE
ncbi:MAG: hypothetical protein JSV24_02760, partial [Bacteroidales bacterium]